MTDMKTHQGSCHCGAVTFEADLSLDGLVECNCSHCYRKGLVLAFAPRAALRVKSGGEGLTEYRFNTHKIAHQTCAACGVEPFAYGQAPDGAETAAVNVRTLTDVEPWGWTAKRIDGRSF